MDDKLIIAIVAAVSAILGGIVTGVLAPFIKHRLEQAVAEKERKRLQIAKWREMVLEVDRAAAGNISPGELLHLHAAYITLEPHLTESARRIARAENRTFVVGQALCLPLETLKSEVARIEKEWGPRK
jgi:hypothetical protein